MIKLLALDFSNGFEAISSAFAIILGLLVLAYPIWIWRFLYKNYKLVNTNKFHTRYSSLVDGLTFRYKEALLYAVIFLLRRAELALLIVMLPNYMWL